MRTNADSQIATAEISDGELDFISGGIASAAASVQGYGASVRVGDVLGTAGSLADTVTDILPVASLTHLAAVQTTPGI
ncbi:hypothetical protein DN069_06150 [Streptacidiphilus pinicola]|uniref:Type A2 lantipeptide n=1 Tax=Streptacidiphilus pinicola TaxID=2219663 RepID=A0A2X0JFY7_9ACTN|nr:hypothetical protein [Streptacidiphilus pinicola]RAG86538.1 hypothetical protein DN069_06150 [Streptacidiphilus pinicola]